MTQIIYHYLNMDTGLLCLNDETLCKEVGHAGHTRAIPYFEGEEFHILIAGGTDFTEEDAIELYKKLTGTIIGNCKPPIKVVAEKEDAG